MDKQYVAICETTQIVQAQDLEIISEQKIDKGYKIAFRTILQNVGLNGNNRYYSHDICDLIVKQLKPKAENRALLMEVDHPLLWADPNKEPIVKKRVHSIRIQESGALLRKIWRDGDYIMGEVETLSGFKGPDIAKLILVDKAQIGFSLRALGALKPRGGNVLEVTVPLHAVTYDIVTNPSHNVAKIVEFLTESMDLSTLFEQQDEEPEVTVNTLEIRGDIIRICRNNECIVGYIDDMIREIFDSLKLKFRLQMPNQDNNIAYLTNRMIKG